MKKSLLAALLVAGLMVIGSHASAQLPTLSMVWASLDAGDFDFPLDPDNPTGPTAGSLWPDMDQDTIPDAAEIAVLDWLVANDAGAAAALNANNTIWQGFIDTYNTLDPPGTPEEATERMLLGYLAAGMATFGDGMDQVLTAYMADLAALALTFWEGQQANMTTVPDATPSGDPDADTMTNLTEWGNAGGDPVVYVGLATTWGTPPLAIATNPSNVSVEFGADVNFTVAATGGEEAYAYQWQFDDGSGFVDLSGEDAATLSIADVSEDNEGSYRCVVTSGAEEVTSNAATLSVAAQVPVMGFAGMGLLVAACAALGVRKAVKK